MSKTQPPGFTFVNNDGYRVVKNDDGGLDREHRRIWEAAHGPIPSGYQIHHINHDRADNRLSNLACVDTVTHKRLHVGHWIVEGVWFKRCTCCGWAGPEDAYPTKKTVNGVRFTRGNCFECDRARVRAIAAARRARMN